MKKKAIIDSKYDSFIQLMVKFNFKFFKYNFFRNIQFKKIFNNLFSRKFQFKNRFKNINLALFNSIKYSFN